MPVVDGLSAQERRHRVYWWKEALLMLAFYLLYSWTRNQFGSNAVPAGEIPFHAFDNAERVIRFQQLFLPYRVFIQFWNTYYGTAHFLVTLVVFALLFWKRPGVFPVWRNSLGIMTGLAIVGFALFPLMPPRLLDKPCDHYGGACIQSDVRPEGGFGFTDTLSEYGGPWSFDSDEMASISNQ